MGQRKKKSVYFTDEEWKLVTEQSKRLGYRKTGEMIRIGILKLASDHVFDELLLPGSLLDPDPKKLKLRTKLVASLDTIIDIFSNNDIHIPGIDDIDKENYDDE